MKICNNEPAWINPKLKSSIRQRQKALAKGNQAQFNKLRNQVNRERKKCRGVFFRTKVSQPKYSKPNQWWKSAKSLCGMDPVSPSNNFDNLLSSTEANPSNSNSLSALANSINQAFLAAMAPFQPLTSEPGTSEDPPLLVSPNSVITEYSVFSQLALLKTSKASGPDGLPSWLLKENADTLAKPVSDIINASYSENCLPPSWKILM